MYAITFPANGQLCMKKVFPSILDQNFKYVPSGKTNIRKTFDRIRKEQKEKQVMSNEAPYQVNLKTPKGSLLNLRAWDEQQLDTILDGLEVRMQRILQLEETIDELHKLSSNPAAQENAVDENQPTETKGETVDKTPDEVAVEMMKGAR